MLKLASIEFLVTMKQGIIPSFILHLDGLPQPATIPLERAAIDLVMSQYPVSCENEIFVGKFDYNPRGELILRVTDSENMDVEVLIEDEEKWSPRASLLIEAISQSPRFDEKSLVQSEGNLINDLLNCLDSLYPQLPPPT